jgi:YidC/Oxa1 family membrane protein insertase
MERRFFVAILLSFVVLYGYQALFVPPTKSPQTPASSSPASAQKPPAVENVPADKNTEVPQPAIEVAAIEGDQREREIVVDTPTVQVVLTNRGGRVLRWRLKGFRDQSGNLVDLVPTDVPADQPRPFSLLVDDSALSQRLNSALYRVIGDANGHVDATKQAAQVAFEFQDANGLRVRKEFSFAPANYVVTFSATVADGDRVHQPTVAWGPALGDAGALAAGGSFFTGNYTQPPEALFHRDGDVERVRADKLAEEGSPEGEFRFAGVDDHYFIVAAIDPGQVRLHYQAVILPGPGDAMRQLIAHTVRPAQSIQNLRFFVGPKQFDVLQAVDPEFTKAINFGMF